MIKRNLTMLTDFYELTMANGYFESGRVNEIGYFDMFFRRVPENGGFAILAGINELIDYLCDLEFTEEDIEYLREKNMFSEGFLDYLANFKFECDVWAVPEGTAVFPGEPLLTVRGPLIQAQLIETMVLLLINHQSLIATKANRIVRAAKGRPVLEFGSRRAQGASAAILGARAAYIGGCAGTACTIADRDMGITALGTMAHSWVQTFPTEYEAFKTYAEVYPDNCVLLVDTYNVLKSGVPNAIRVFKEMKPKKMGIRIDSGDVSYLTKKARKMLDEAGFPDASICASNDLDEYLLMDLKVQGAKINVWGIGTNLITSKDCPAFGGVYKLAAIMNERGEFVPKIKISENSAKITNPGNKTIYRIYDNETGKMKADLICFVGEQFDTNKDLVLFDPIDTWKKTILEGGTYTMREILVPIFRKGECIYKSPSVKEIAAYCREEKETLWDETKRFFNPHKVYVDLSDKLYSVKRELLSKV